MTAQQETPETGNETQADNETANETLTPSVTFDDQESDGTTVTVSNVTVPDGGYVVIHDELLQDGDALNSVIGVSAYLEPGQHDEVTITLFDVPGADFGSETTAETTTETTETATETQTETNETTTETTETATEAQTETNETTTETNETTNETTTETATETTETATETQTTETADGSEQVTLTEDQTLTAMLHVDSNDNQTFDYVTTFSLEDGPYVVAGEPVTDSANVTVADTGNETTETSTESGTETATPTESGTETATPTETPTESGTVTETPTEGGTDTATPTGTPGEATG